MNLGDENSFKLCFLNQQMDHSDEKRTVNLDIGDTECCQSVDAGPGGAWGLSTEHRVEISFELGLEIFGGHHVVVVMNLRPVDDFQ